MEELKGEKINCDCGSVVLKKNLASHVKTKKHQACLGPPSLHRNTGVSFADAQHTDRADVSDDEEDDMDDGEELGKAHLVLDQKLDNIMNTLANLLNVVQKQAPTQQ